MLNGNEKYTMDHEKYEKSKVRPFLPGMNDQKTIRALQQ